MITLESVKMWVAYVWSVPLIGQGLNLWGSTHLKQLRSHCGLWIQGEKATGAGHSQQKCVPNMDWWFWLIRICRKWGNAITILGQLSVGFLTDQWQRVRRRFSSPLYCEMYKPSYWYCWGEIFNGLWDCCLKKWFPVKYLSVLKW